MPSPRMLTGWGRRAVLALMGSVVAVALLAPAGASAASPSIINTGTGCAGQTSWLVSCATGGEAGTGGNANFLRISALVSHDAPNTIPSLVTDDDWDGTVDPTTVRTVSAERPATPGGYPRSRVDLSYQIPTANTGMSCDGFPTFGGTRRTDNRNARIQARDSASQTSGTSSSQIKFVAAGSCTGPEDFAYLYNVAAGNFNRAATPGQSFTYTYNGDDSDTTGDSDFQGINWRYRNLRTGATTGATLSCPGGGDNSSKTLTAAAPSTRGAYVLEAELRDGDGCGQNQNPGYWFAVGTVDVNGSTIPAPTLSASRPVTNGNTTITLDPPTDPDSGSGGGPQIAQWDLDENNANGVSGFEVDNIAGEGAIISSNLARTINTTGQSPGLHTVRARVIDNGAMDAADSIRRTSSTATTTYLVNSAPVATAQTVTSETGTGKAITLSGTDANGDTLTYSIVSGPSNGTLTGTGANRTYTSNSTFAGTDSFVFQANDGFGGTSNATVTINVEPNTVINSAPSGTINSRGGQVSFSSAATGATFECSLDGATFATCSSPQSFTDLADGSHTFSVRALAASQADNSPATATFTVDAFPTVTIDSGPPPTSQQNTATFTFTASEAGSTQPVTTECRVDADPFVSCSSPFTTGALGEGSHTFDVRATDSFGKQSTDSLTFAVDTTAPETTIDTGPTGDTNDPTPTFEFSSSEPGSTFECSVDGATFAGCTSPFTTDPLGEGAHTVAVRATDAAGNTDQSPASRSFTVDLTSPDTQITSGPSGPIANATPTFEFTSPDTPAATFECSVDGATFTSCSSPFTIGQLLDGGHTFEVRAIDPAGNIDPVPASSSFTVDVTVPETTITGAPPSATPTNDPTPDFSFEADEAGVSFECKIDSGEFAVCASPFTAPNLVDGLHAFSVRAIDAAGNVDGSPATATFTVDTVAPVSQVTGGPSGPTSDQQPQFTFTSDADAGTECRIDSDAFTPCTSPFTAPLLLSDGTHTFEVRGTDVAGNVEAPPASRSFTVDTIVPETSIDTGPGALTNDPTPTFAFSSPDGATFACELDGEALVPCTSPLTLSNQSDVQHTLTVTAVDAAGNEDPTPASRTFTVDTAPPSTAIDNAPETTNQSTFQVGFSSTSPDTVSFECAVDSTAEASFAACSSPQSFTLADGVHQISVRAVDGAGNRDTDPADTSVRVDSTEPSSSFSSGPTGLTNDSTPTFLFTADESVDGFECSFDSATGPWAACESPLTSGTLADGPHTLYVRATDTASNVESSPASRAFTVDTVAPDTAVAEPAVSGDSATFTFSSADGSATFQCRIDGGAYSACISPKTYPGLAVGSHTFEVRATDAATNVDASPASAAATITAPVTPPPPGPGPTPEPTPTACSVLKRGTAKANNLTGTALGDKLLGLRGNDRIRGLAGDDCLAGGAGNDKLAGGPGIDKLTGGAGNDKLAGGPGADTLTGGGGIDVISAKGGGKDSVRCGAGDKVKADKSDRVTGACTKGTKK